MVKDNDSKKKKSGGFQSLGLSPPIFRAIMAMGYKVPTPIQRKALPVVLSGRDVVAMARTGSGKTAAFLIPMLEKLKEHSTKIGVRAVVLSPTRELAVQTLKFTKSMAKFTTLKASLIVGGDSMDQQFSALASNPDIIVATPGRLMHHLQEIPDFNLRSTEYVVFDEADRLFEMGFAEQLQEVLKSMPDSRQTVLFSATLPRALVQFARAGLSDPELMRLDVDNKISENLKLAYFSVRSEDKPAAFLYILRNLIPREDQTIVFAATRHHVEFLHELLKASGIDSAFVYGDMDQTARKINVGKFRARKTNVLIVTDVAARGIDIPLLNNVFNYHFSSTPKLFVHRVGRAARAGRKGTAFNFIDNEELPYLVDLHLYLGKKIDTIDPLYGTHGNNKLLPHYSLDSMTTETVHIGRIPQELIDQETEYTRDLMEGNSQVAPLVKVCSNAWKQYSRTRSDPSKQSISRSKSMNVDSIHPLFAIQLDEDDVCKNQYRNQLKGFRPKQTIFEVSTGPHSLKKNSAGVVMMKTKRNELKKIQSLSTSISMDGEKDSKLNSTMLVDTSKKRDIAAVETKKRLSKADRKRLKKGVPVAAFSPTNSNVPCATVEKNFKDEEHYIGYMKDEDRVTEQFLTSGGESGKSNSFMNARLEQAILDVNPDEAMAMNDKKRILHWDSRKKKYIKTTVKEVRSGQVNKRNECGAKVEKSKVKPGDIYKKWQKRMNDHVAFVGKEENTSGIDYRGGRRHSSMKPKIGSAVKDELKSESVIRKEEKKKMKSRGIRKSSKKSSRGKRNLPGKSHGAPTRSKAIIRK